MVILCVNMHVSIANYYKAQKDLLYNLTACKHLTTHVCFICVHYRHRPSTGVAMITGIHPLSGPKFTVALA